jgi:hypothetical protein
LTEREYRTGIRVVWLDHYFMAGHLSSGMKHNKLPVKRKVSAKSHTIEHSLNEDSFHGMPKKVVIPTTGRNLHATQDFSLRSK